MIVVLALLLGGLTIMGLVVFVRWWTATKQACHLRRYHFTKL